MMYGNNFARLLYYPAQKIAWQSGWAFPKIWFRWLRASVKRQVTEDTVILLNKKDVSDSTVDVHGKVPVVMRRRVEVDVRVDLQDVILPVYSVISGRLLHEQAPRDRHVEARKKPRGSA